MTMTACVLLAATGLLLAAGASRADAGAAADVDEPLRGLREGHPRLILTDERLEELKRLSGTDDLLAKAVRDALSRADDALEKPPIAYKVIGPRLLRVSRDMVDRAYALGFAWRWTGRKAYAEKLRDDLKRVAAFPDWNPSHFLDTAEMSHAVGIGYDWLFEVLGEADRRTIREGLIRHGLNAGLAAYGLRKDAKIGKAWWVGWAYNWNNVCSGGLVAGALAIAGSHPQYAEQIVPQAVASLPRALATYAPDGAWGEGPGYWGYATRYTVYALASMRTALGGDFGLSEAEGLDQAGYFPLYGAGPAGLYFNFADVSTHARRGNLPSLLWLGKRYEKPALIVAERQRIRRHAAEVRDVIWYAPAPDNVPRLPGARRFRGIVPVATFRRDWSDRDALYLAVKAGSNQVNHGHLDLGTFVMDALGRRWAWDLGSDDYNLPGYWQGDSADGKRWTYYRLNSLSHNVVLLDGASQDVHAESDFARVETQGDSPWAIVDLDEAYRPKARSARRGVKVLDYRAVLIQDELELAESAKVTWAMTTRAEISVDGATATLALDGRKLRATLLAPAGVSWTEESAARRPPEATNEGFRRLVAHLPARKGAVHVTVLLAPVWPEGGATEMSEVVPLSDWR